MRVALFGGTFDPPHLGHMGIARAAAEAFALETILFAPVGHQPLKPGMTLTTFADRFAMTRLACERSGKPAGTQYLASTLDAPQPNGEPNFTVDTLARLQQQMPSATLYNLVGADSFLMLRKWRDPERLLQLAEWIVVSRPGYSLEDLTDLRLTPAERARVHLLQTVHYDVSSTALRQRLAAGDECRDLLPGAVADYIHSHGLYHAQP